MLGDPEDFAQAQGHSLVTKMQNPHNLQQVTVAPLGPFSVQRGDILKDIFNRRIYYVEGVYLNEQKEHLLLGHYDGVTEEKLYMPVRNFEMIR
jgi:hypothetical protein